MQGKIGSLWTGRLQLGGILDYSLDLILADSVKDTATVYKLAKWKLTAQSYWLFDIPPARVVIRLYPDTGKGYWEGIGIISSKYQKLLDVLIHESIEFIGEGVMEGKE